MNFFFLPHINQIWSKKVHFKTKIYLFYTFMLINFSLQMLEVRKKLNWFFQNDVSSKNRTSKFYFTTMKPLVDLFLFVFWKKLKTPKRHFEFNWPLVCCRHYHLTGIFKHLIWRLNPIPTRLCHVIYCCGKKVIPA